MAYLKQLHWPCATPGCPREARVELFNAWNASQGCYCRPCGTRQLRALTQVEQRAARHGA